MEAINSAKGLIEKSRNILIFPCRELQGDSLGSALALFYTLRKLGRNVNLNVKDVPEKFRFLTDFGSLGSEEFVISINTEDKEISQMRYEKNGNDLKIHLALSKGQVKSNDVSFAPFLNETASIGRPDLLITLGVKSLEEVPQSLWEAPILNIDNQLQNENFGEVNLIETVSSLAEITASLIKLMGKDELFDEKTATCLLTGVIWSSQNFRNPKTRPKTFEASAFLIERGANHQEIIQRLYKQKNISQIKLLGKVLENLNFHEQNDVYSAALKENDFKECQASSKDLSFVLEELKFHFRHLPNLLILWESHASPPMIKGIFYSPDLSFVQKITENFESVSKGNGIIFLVREADLGSAKEKVLSVL